MKRKLFISKELMKEDTFLYGINMPGFMAMCLTTGAETVEFEKAEEISKEELNDFDNLYIVEKNSQLLHKIIAEVENWDMIIGISVDMERETSKDIQTRLESFYEA